MFETTLLDIDSAYNDGKVLQQLAHSLPQVTQLRVRGYISRATLASYGTNLHTLQIVGTVHGCEASVSPDTLPRLTHLLFESDIVPDLGCVRFPASQPQLVVAGLVSCMTVASYGQLTHMTLQGYGMPPAVWDALPACLQHLDCIMSDPLLPASQPLAQLRTLKLYRWDNIFHLGILVSYLRLTAQCEVLELVNRPGYTALSDWKPYVFADCTPDSYDEISFLNGLVSSGMNMTHGLNFHFSSGVSNAQFFTGLPTLLSVSGLLLDCACSIMNPMIPNTLPVRCPNLTSFGLLGKLEATKEELAHLTRCADLQHISLASIEDTFYSSADMGMLCSSVRSLRVLQLQRKSNLAAAKIAASIAKVQQELDASDSLVQLVLYTDPRLAYVDLDVVDVVDVDEWTGEVVSIRISSDDE